MAQDPNQPGTDTEIPGGTSEAPNDILGAVSEGGKEATFEEGLNYVTAAAPAASITDLPVNSFLDIAKNGTGNPLLDSTFMPLMRHMPGFQEATQKAQKEWNPGLMNNDITRWMHAGMQAHKFTEEYYPGETLAKLVSKAGQQQKLDIQTTGGLANISPVNLAATATRALTNSAWRDVAKYAANRIAYHTTKIAVPLITGTLMGSPAAGFAVESMGRNARALEKRTDLSPAQREKAVLMKAAADGFMAHVMTAIPGITNEIMPFAQKVIGTVGEKTGEQILLEGIKKALTEGILEGVPKDALLGFTNMAANQIVNMAVDQYFKIQNWHIQQAILAAVQAGLFGSLVQSVLGPTGRFMRKINIHAGLPTYSELQTAKQVIEGHINGVPDGKGNVVTLPHVVDGRAVEGLNNIQYMLDNKMWRDADPVYRHILHFADGLKNDKGFAGPKSEPSKLDKYLAKQKQEIKQLKEERDWREGEIKITSEIDKAKAVKRAEERAAKYGYKAGRDEALQEAKDKIQELQYQNRWNEAEKNTAQAAVVKYLQDYAPADIRGKFLTTIRDAKDPFELAKVTDKIDQAVKRYQKSQVIENLQTKVEKIRNSGQIATEYKAQIDQMLDMFNTSTPKEETLAKLKDLQHWINDQRAGGKATFIPQLLLDAVKPLGRQNLRSMSLDELKSTFNNVSMLAEKGKEVLADRQALDNAQKQDIRDQILDTNTRRFDISTKGNWSKWRCI